MTIEVRLERNCEIGVELDGTLYPIEDSQSSAATTEEIMEVLNGTAVG